MAGIDDSALLVGDFMDYTSITPSSKRERESEDEDDDDDEEDRKRPRDDSHPANIVHVVGQSRYRQVLLTANIANGMVSIDNAHIRGWFRVPLRNQPLKSPNAISMKLAALPNDLREMVTDYLDPDLEDHVTRFMWVADEQQSLRDPPIRVQFHGWIEGDKGNDDRNKQDKYRWPNVVEIDRHDGECAIHAHYIPEFWLRFTLPDIMVRRLRAPKKSVGDIVAKFTASSRKPGISQGSVQQ